MRFDRIELTNFRSFGPETETLRFPDEENFLALVGANNAGKSNLLSGLRLVLGAQGNFSPDPADFHQLDLDIDLRIELHLREPLKLENAYRKVDSVHGFFLRAWRPKQGNERGQIKTEHYGFDADGKTYIPPAAVGRRGALDEDVEPVRFVPAPARTLIRRFGRVNYLSPRLYRAFETSGSGVLAQLLNLYRDDFRAAENTYDLPGGGGTVQRGEAYDKFSARLEEILRTDKLVEIEGSLSANLSAVLGPTAGAAAVTLAMPTAEELLSEILSLRVQDEEAAPSLAVERIGAGYQSLLRLAVLRTYADLSEQTHPAVFLIEEPEAYLNPHLRRFFNSTLRLLAEQGNDVVVTTHDPAFVNLAQSPTVARVAKNDGRSVVYRSEDPLDFSYERVATKIRRGGNAEVLFAARAVLCEGPSDLAVIRALLDASDLDPDSLNISVIECGGRDQIPDYVRLLDALHIPLLVVSDGDTAKAEADEQTRKKVERLAEAARGRHFVFTEDIETALGCEKKTDNAQNLLSVTASLDLASLPAEHEIAKLLLVLNGFCSPQSSSE